MPNFRGTLLRPLLVLPLLTTLLLAVPHIDATNALGTTIDVNSADGQYHFHLTADVIEGRMRYPPLVPGGKAEEYTTFHYTVTNVTEATLLHPFGPTDRSKYGCSLTSVADTESQLLAVVLELEVRVSDSSDMGASDKSGTAGCNTSSIACAKPEVGPWTMVLAFEETRFDNHAPSYFRLVGNRLLAEVNNVTTEYGECDPDAQYDWNTGYGSGSSQYIMSGHELRVCRGYRCSMSQLIFEEAPKVFTVFWKLDTKMTRTSDHRFGHLQHCDRVCPADQGLATSTTTRPSIITEPTVYPHYYPHHPTTFVWSLLTRVVIFLAVGMLVYLALRWKREWKEQERRRALLPKVGYFCPRPPPPAAAPTQQQQQVPIQNSLYIIPPPYYGMAAGGGGAADSDTVEKEGVENLKFY